MIQALLLYGARPRRYGRPFCARSGNADIHLVGPLLMPKAWQQMLRLLSDQPPEQLRRIGGSLVVAGTVILWMLSH